MTIHRPASCYAAGKNPAALASKILPSEDLPKEQSKIIVVNCPEFGQTALNTNPTVGGRRRQRRHPRAGLARRRPPLDGHFWRSGGSGGRRRRRSARGRTGPS